jgi:hypothetical protein
MPKRLLERCRPDSVAEFQAAARQRLRDGLSLAAQGRRTAAIYLWGYAAEMTLKAAYFRVIGFPWSQQISLKDLHAAKVKAGGLGITWAGNFHDLRAWADLLVATRNATPVLGYPNAGFGNRVLGSAAQLQRLWSEVLRYHKNIAYRHELRQVREAVEWLLVNASNL